MDINSMSLSKLFRFKLFITAIIVLPLVVQVVQLLAIAVYAFCMSYSYPFTFTKFDYVELIASNRLLLFVSPILPIFVLFWLGYRHGKQVSLPEERRAYFSILTIIIGVVLLTWLLLAMTMGDTSSRLMTGSIVSFFPFFLIIINNMLLGLPVLTPVLISLYYLSYLLAFLHSGRLSGYDLFVSKLKIIFVSLSCSLMVLLLVMQWQSRYSSLGIVPFSLTERISEEPVYLRAHELDLKAISFDETERLKFESDHPILSGELRFVDLYLPVIANYYQLDEKNIRSLLRARDYGVMSPDMLDSGQLDILIQSEILFKKGQEVNNKYIFIPVAREALVFFVNQANPVTALTVEQIQKIYVGDITNWLAINNQDKPILPFQRWTYSSSQNAMQDDVMVNHKMISPLQEEGLRRGGYKIHIADYQNKVNAIGYSYSNLVRKRNQSDDIKVLSINGIEPTDENIRNGRYPFSYNVYLMVNTKQIKENTRKLVAWYLSPQGQQFIENMGYIPISNTN